MLEELTKLIGVVTTQIVNIYEVLEMSAEVTQKVAESVKENREAINRLHKVVEENRVNLNDKQKEIDQLAHEITVLEEAGMYDAMLNQVGG